MKENKYIYRADQGRIEYIGYIEMLDNICKMMDKVGYDNKLILIDKYIEILKVSKVNNENN